MTTLLLHLAACSIDVEMARTKDPPGDAAADTAETGGPQDTGETAPDSPADSVGPDTGCDTGGPVSCRLDEDGDGWGVGDPVDHACGCPSGWVPEGDADCDDAHAEAHPDGEETCDDGLDGDCDGLPGPCLIEGALSVASPDAAVGGYDGDAGWGYQFVAAGDLDGDGAAELIASQPGEEAFHGVVLVFDGTSLALDATLTGERDASSGTELAADGDVDGDGLVDLAISGPNYAADTGVVWLVTGGAADGPLAGHVRIVGTTVGDRLGWAGLYYQTLTLACDLDDDGIRELAVGAPRAGFGEAGRAWVMAAPSSDATLADADHALSGDADGDHLGHSLACGVGEDGGGRLVVGAPGQGDAGAVQVRDEDGLRATWVGEAAPALGDSLAATGDMDGAGGDEVLLGAEGAAWLLPIDGDGLADAVATFSGPADLTMGLVGGFDADDDGASDLLLGSADGGGWLVYGPVAGAVDVSSEAGATWADASGFLVAAGDLDGDGFDDVVLGDTLETEALAVFRGGGF